MSTPAITKLGDSGLHHVRCSGCCDDFAQSAPAEEYRTPDSRWIVVTCPKCGDSTPFQLQKESEVL